MNSLNEKRNKAVLTIIGTTIINSGGAAVPTPGVETGKHAVFSAAEIVMCTTIYNTYFSENISKDEIKDFLTKNGIAVGGGGGMAFVGTKLGHSAVAEMLNFFPVVGWGIKSLLAGSITASIGAACMKVCHTLAEANRSQ